ncbi:MAG: response regulator [Pyrinomonadaceae bacterium]
MTSKLKILLAEDHQIVREGLKLLLNSQPDMEVVGEAGDGEIAIEMVKTLQPDIIIMDISMPRLNGLMATKRLRAANSDVKILTLSRHTDDGYLQQLIAAGVNGYVLKQSAPTHLINAIREVASDNSYVDPALTKRVIEGFSNRSGLRGEGPTELSNRESEVLRLIALGYSNKEIATQMNLSVKTIEAHKANSMRKLGMSGRIDIVRYAILQGWMENES